MGNKKKRSRSIRQAAFVVGLLCLVGFGVPYLWALKEDLKLFPVEFVQPDGSKSPTFRLKVANTEELRSKGLMFVKEMKPQHGMLFVFPTTKLQSFWMKNTFVSLDMMFIDEKLEVVGLLKNVPILNSTPRKVDQPSRYVIELNAGSADRYGIREGSRVEFKRAVPNPE